MVQVGNWGLLSMTHNCAVYKKFFGLNTAERVACNSWVFQRTNWASNCCWRRLCRKKDCVTVFWGFEIKMKHATFVFLFWNYILSSEKFFHFKETLIVIIFIMNQNKLLNLYLSNIVTLDISLIKFNLDLNLKFLKL